MSQIFSVNDKALFFRLLLSHLLFNFVIQRVQRNRRRPLRRHWRSLLAGLFAFIVAGNWFTGSWQSVWLIGFVGIIHGLIDYLKSTYGNRQPLYDFFAEQAAYISALLIAWLLLTTNWISFWKLLTLIFTDHSFMAVLSGYSICTAPVGHVVGLATIKWQRQLRDFSNLSNTLEDAGKWIGIAERIVIFSFVLVDQYEAIGFLIAAKSLLRFREGDGAARQSEYVLVGTLLSYAFAILIGLLTKLTIQ